MSGRLSSSVRRLLLQYNTTLHLLAGRYRMLLNAFEWQGLLMERHLTSIVNALLFCSVF